MKASKAAAAMVAGIILSFLFAIIAASAIFFVCTILLFKTNYYAAWIPKLVGSFGLFTAIGTFLFGIRTSWRYSQGRTTIPRRGDRRFEITILLAIAGALSSGGLVLGVIFVSHGPISVDVNSVGPAAVIGLLIGGAIGLLLGFTHRST